MVAPTPEEVADLLVSELSAGNTGPDRLVARLRKVRRPYFAWALAWAEMEGAAERDPDDHRIRRALAALRAVEPEVSDLDGRYLASPEVA